MPPQTINNDQNSTWTIDGDNKTWTLAKQATITVDDTAAIDVLSTSAGNNLNIFGDISASGDGGQGILVAGDNTHILLGKNSEIEANDGIYNIAKGLDITNNGEIHGLDYGIFSWTKSEITNGGEISGNSAITSLKAATIVNGENGVITGDAFGINIALGTESLVINHGVINGNDIAVRILSLGENRFFNTGTINGDVVFGIGDDVLNSQRGELNGVIYGGDGNDTYRIGRNDVLTIELANEGMDTIYVRTDYLMDDNTERMFLTGRKNIDASGNPQNNFIKGNVGDNAIAGNNGDDRIAGGKGDDVLFGGAHDDTFVFNEGYDRDRIEDFVNFDDVIEMSGFAGVASFDDLEAKMSSHGSDVWIQLGQGDRLIIENTELGELDANDFHITA